MKYMCASYVFQRLFLIRIGYIEGNFIWQPQLNNYHNTKIKIAYVFSMIKIGRKPSLVHFETIGHSVSDLKNQQFSLFAFCWWSNNSKICEVWQKFSWLWRSCNKIVVNISLPRFYHSALNIICLWSQGRMKLFGTHVYPKNKYLTLQLTRSSKGVMCEDIFESLVSLVNFIFILLPCSCFYHYMGYFCPKFRFCLVLAA